MHLLLQRAKRCPVHQIKIISQVTNLTDNLMQRYICYIIHGIPMQANFTVNQINSFNTTVHNTGFCCFIYSKSDLVSDQLALVKPDKVF